jgi:hypothetical protein
VATDEAIHEAVLAIERRPAPSRRTRRGDPEDRTSSTRLLVRLALFGFFEEALVPPGCLAARCDRDAAALVGEIAARKVDGRRRGDGPRRNEFRPAAQQEGERQEHTRQAQRQRFVRNPVLLTTRKCNPCRASTEPAASIRSISQCAHLTYHVHIAPLRHHRTTSLIARFGHDLEHDRVPGEPATGGSSSGVRRSRQHPAIADRRTREHPTALPSVDCPPTVVAAYSNGALSKTNPVNTRSTFPE